jgi:Cysteine-rich secretory protein family
MWVIRITLPKLLTCLLLCLFAPHAQAQHPAPRPPTASQFDAAGEAQLVELINRSRAQQGLPPYSLDSRLTEAARKHTELMEQNGELSHQFPGEPAVDVRVSNEGLPSDREGENIDLNQTISGAHDALMRSPPHRANILDPEYNAVGVSVIRSGEDIYVTEDFARRLPQYSEPQAEAAVQESIQSYQRAHGFPAPVRKPLTPLRRLACDMALNDSLDLTPASKLPNVHDVFGWTGGNPAELPKGIERLMGAGLAGGYSLGACFAPSVSHPGGVYWLIMVSY